MKRDHQNHTKLTDLEQLTLIFLLGLIITVCAASYSRRTPPDIEILKKHAKPLMPLVNITVDGAVASPGVCRVNKGTPISKLLKKIELLPEADITPLNAKSRLHRSKKLWIPFKNKVAVTLKGAVKRPGRHLLPKGTKIRDLPDLDVLTHNADTKALKKRRAQLKDNQIFEVPFDV